MNRIFPWILVLTLSFGYLAEAQNTAVSYIRKVTGEQKKIRAKQINYYKTLMNSADEKRLDKNREMIVTQVNATIQAVKRIPNYQGDSTVRNDYLRVLNLYTISYNTGFQQMMLTKAEMNQSGEKFNAYQDALGNMEGMIDDAEYKYDRVITYFNTRYNLSQPEDPIQTELEFLREFSAYVQDIRNAVTEPAFIAREMQTKIKAEQYDDLMDMCKSISKSTERGAIAVTQIGPWLDEKQKSDTFLMDAALNAMDNIRRMADGNLYTELMALEDASLDGKSARSLRVGESVSNLLETIIKIDADFNKRLIKFVSAYVKE